MFLSVSNSALQVDGVATRLWKVLSTIFWVAIAGTMFTVSIVSLTLSARHRRVFVLCSSM